MSQSNLRKLHKCMINIFSTFVVFNFFFTSRVRMMPTEERSRGKKAQGLSQEMVAGWMAMQVSLK